MTLSLQHCLWDGGRPILGVILIRTTRGNLMNCEYSKPKIDPLWLENCVKNIASCAKLSIAIHSVTHSEKKNRKSIWRKKTKNPGRSWSLRWVATDHRKRQMMSPRSNFTIFWKLLEIYGGHCGGITGASFQWPRMWGRCDSPRFMKRHSNCKSALSIASLISWIS